VSGLEKGDEPTMLARRLPGAIFFSRKNRIISAREAVKKGVSLILFDDALQCRYVYRDIELVILNSENPFGFNYFLPTGLLRDSPTRLSQADAVFLNGNFNQAILQKIQATVKAPLIGVQLKIKRVLSLKGDERNNFFSNAKVGIFCAISHPKRFLKTVENSGAQVVKTLFLADHENFDFESLYDFAIDCRKKKAQALICTEKDSVKLNACMYETSFPLPVVYLEMEMAIVYGQSDWQNLIEKIAFKIDDHRKLNPS
jgi:tetraacyldisaccharide 4'-kinase